MNWFEWFFYCEIPHIMHWLPLLMKTFLNGFIEQVINEFVMIFIESQMSLVDQHKSDILLVQSRPRINRLHVVTFRDGRWCHHVKLSFFLKFFRI